MSTQPNALTVKVNSVRKLLESMKPQLAMALPKHMDPDRLLRIALTATQRTPALLDCDRTSLLAAVVQTAQLGLEPDNTLGHAYLIPFKGQVQLIPGYKGLIELARRSGRLKTVEAHVVCARDTFKVTHGLEPSLEHRPWMGPACPTDVEAKDYEERFQKYVAQCDPGPVIAAYAIAHFKDGGYQFEVMSRRELEAIRSRSKAAHSGPWVTDTIEMYRKTVLRRASKMWPLSPELARAVALDDQAAAGINQDLGDVIDISAAPTEDEPEKGALDSVKEKLKAESKVIDIKPQQQEQPTADCAHPDVKRPVALGKAVICPACTLEVRE